MTIVYGGHSALQLSGTGGPVVGDLFRCAAWEAQDNPSLLHACNRPDAAAFSKPTPEELALAKRRFGHLLSEPWQLLAPTVSERSQRRDLAFQVTGHPLPKGSVAQIEQGVFVAHPALVLAGLSRTCAPEHVAVAGCELCGCFRKDPSSPSGFVGAEPLLQREDLEIGRAHV